MVKFGRLPHNPRALAVAPKHLFGAVMPAPKLDLSKYDFEVGLWNNDTDPDCTAVSLANVAKGVASRCGYQLIIDPTKPLNFYGASIGAPPGTDLSTTDGANMLDVAHFQAANGYDIGPQLLVAIVGTVPLNRLALARSLQIMGGWWGVRLYERDMENYLAGKPFPTPTPDDGKQIGGHAIGGWDYTGLADTDTVRVMTWGGYVPAPWTWLEARLDEAHGPVWRELARAQGGFYDGLSINDLLNEANNT
jgi:hypothetical protein